VTFRGVIDLVLAGIGGKSMTVERSILLVVGLVVLATVLLAAYHNINWLWGTGLLGLSQHQLALGDGSSRRASRAGLFHRHLPGGDDAQEDGAAVEARLRLT